MFKNIRESLRKTRQTVFGQIVNVLGVGEIDDDTWDDLEALLIQSDMGVETTHYLLDTLRQRVWEARSGSSGWRYTPNGEWTIGAVRPGAYPRPTGVLTMKHGRAAAALVVTGAALVLSGCGNGQSSSSTLASNEAMAIPSPTPARQRGLMYASDSLGRAVFPNDSAAMASVPDRDQ